MQLYKMTFPYPIGSTNKETLLAPVVNPSTTKEMVSNSDNDAPFFRELEKQGIHLNIMQTKAVRKTEGPLCVIAGAGSGKTRVLTARTSYILKHDKNVLPEQIMLITYTKKAAAEIVERLELMLPPERIAGIVYGTFHSVFLKILRSNNYTQNILSSDSYRGVIINKILKDLKIHELYAPETILRHIATFKNNLLSWSDIVPNTRAEHDFVLCYKAYEEWKDINKYLDFDDILIESHRLITSNVEYANSLREHFRYICIDEYQDSNLVQHELIKALTTDQSNVFFVGDPDQLIYSFNNSSEKYLKELSIYYPSIEIITLSTNYRSTQTIVGASNKVISFNVGRFEKECESTITSDSGVHYFRPSDSEEEARMITDHIVSLTRNDDTQSLNDFAVLYRTHSVSRAIIDELAYRNIPYVIYGRNQLFYNHNYIKPLMGYLKVISSCSDIQGFADLAQTLYLEREKVYYAGVNYHVENPTKPLMNALFSLPLKQFQVKQIRNRIQLMEKISGFEPVYAIKRLRRAFYDKFFETSQEQTIHQTYLYEMLDELEAAARRFKTIDAFVQFVEQVTDSYEDMEKQEQPEAIRLMTIHQSKGLEFPVVFTLGVSEKIIPHTSALQTDKLQDRNTTMNMELALAEERRILFVAMSRAKKELFISSPKTYHNKKTQVSRFLLEAYS